MTFSRRALYTDSSIGLLTLPHQILASDDPSLTTNLSLGDGRCGGRCLSKRPRLSLGLLRVVRWPPGTGPAPTNSNARSWWGSSQCQIVRSMKYAFRARSLRSLPRSDSKKFQNHPSPLGAAKKSLMFNRYPRSPIRLIAARAWFSLFTGAGKPILATSPSRRRSHPSGSQPVILQPSPSSPWFSAKNRTVCG